MRFAPTDEQVQLGEAIDDMAVSAGGASVARAWGDGDHAPGLALWSSIAESGIVGLRVAEEEGGAGGTVVDLAVLFDRLGYHAAPGPYLESIALLPSLLPAETRSGLAEGSVIATAAVEGFAPYAVDADVATHAFALTATSITTGTAAGQFASLDPARRLFRLAPDDAATTLEAARVTTALDETALAAAAFLVGAGERVLRDTVAYAKVREQFGRSIGEYQSTKHALANVHVALTFARPLVHGAALAIGTPTAQRSISAAKVAATRAALLAATTGLQVHGAIGYTAEHDLSLWLLRIRALAGVWGTVAQHRARIAESLAGDSQAEG